MIHWYLLRDEEEEEDTILDEDFEIVSAAAAWSRAKGASFAEELVEEEEEAEEETEDDDGKWRNGRNEFDNEASADDARFDEALADQGPPRRAVDAGPPGWAKGDTRCNKFQCGQLVHQC